MEKVTYILLFMIAPVSIGLIVRYWLKKTYSWKEFLINIGVVLALVSSVFIFGSMSQLIDYEIWNGEIVSKKRHHDSYVRSYDCNCYESCSGTGSSKSCTTICQTCYEDHYTVTWSARSTVGEIRFKHLDRISKSVYSEPDPKAYTRCQQGEPASLEHPYINYVKATPDSLFNMNTDASVYPVPAYPKVRSFYKLSRVISVKTKVETKVLNGLLNDGLKKLGAKKQVNIVVIVTGINDSSFRHEVENKWLGGKKNDAVIFIGVDGNTIIWSDVMTWALNSGNELYSATLKDRVLGLEEYSQSKIAQVILDTTAKLYDRPRMSDYEYLKDDISPPFWLLVLCFFGSIVSSLLLTVYFHKNEV